MNKKVELFFIVNNSKKLFRKRRYRENEIFLSSGKNFDFESHLIAYSNFIVNAHFVLRGYLKERQEIEITKRVEIFIKYFQCQTKNAADVE